MNERQYQNLAYYISDLTQKKLTSPMHSAYSN